jgi:hypothetical protein
MALERRAGIVSRNQDWVGRNRTIAAVSYRRAEIAGQVRFVLLMAAAVAAGSAAVASHWGLPSSWLVPQWLLEWLMPRVP